MAVFTGGDYDSGTGSASVGGFSSYVILCAYGTMSKAYCMAVKGKNATTLDILGEASITTGGSIVPITAIYDENAKTLTLKHYTTNSLKWTPTSTLKDRIKLYYLTQEE